MAARRRSNITNETMEAIKMIQNGLTARQLLVLEQLQAGSLTQSELCNELISQASMTQIIDKLELAGFVRRTRGIQDRRQYHVNLTEKGQALLT